MPLPPLPLPPRPVAATLSKGGTGPGGGAGAAGAAATAAPAAMSARDAACSAVSRPPLVRGERPPEESMSRKERSTEMSSAPVGSSSSPFSYWRAAGGGGI